mgnify:CR=1 FL=1
MVTDTVTIGAAVVDETIPAANANLQTVVNLPPVRCDEWEVKDDRTVAEWGGNEAYPDDDRVAVTVFGAPGAVREQYPEWDGEDPLPLTRIAERDGAGYYAWPVSRLERVEIDTWPIRQAFADRDVDGLREVEDGLVVEWLGDEFLVRPDGTVSNADGVIADRLEDVAQEAAASGGGGA